MTPRRNLCEQYEARFVMVKVSSDKSILFDGMADSMLPVSVAHGEGRMNFATAEDYESARSQGLVSLQFVDNYGDQTEMYPANPNGSAHGVTALTNEDGRFTIMMPHPERVFRTVTNSWHPQTWGDESPWARIFHNARKWVA